jgi:nicotinamidase-related amidase
MIPYTLADFDSTALITIDMQNGFSLPTSPFAVSGTMEVVRIYKPCCQLLDKPINPLFIF